MNGTRRPSFLSAILWKFPGKFFPLARTRLCFWILHPTRHIVQIFNADGTQLITTILAINDYRLKPTGDTVMKFSERPGDAPDALRAWFYPGNSFRVPAVAVETLDE